MVAEIGEFKGHPIIKLARDENDKYPFSFGLSKAKLVLEHFEDIKRFVTEVEALRSSEKKDK